MLRCSDTTVETHARAGRLPGLKLGEGWIFPRVALLQAVDHWAVVESQARFSSAQAKPQALSQPVKVQPLRPVLPQVD